jgi:hypothetical protein
LENIGIGRPSTYAAILKNVQTRGYLEDDNKYLRPTPTGNLVVDTLTTRFSFVEYEFTRNLEQQLDDIAEGKAQYLAVVATADEQLQRELSALRQTPRVSYHPGAPAWQPPSSQAAPASFRNSSSYTNKNEPTPWHASDRLATPRPEGAPAPLATTPPPATIKPEPTKRATRKLSTASTPKAAKTPRKPRATKEQETQPQEISCPICKTGILRLPREDAKFYGCSAYAENNCRFLIWRTIAGRTLKPAEIATLCRDGKTGKLSGFTSKAGRPFEAALVLTPEGKVEFSFQPRA